MPLQYFPNLHNRTPRMGMGMLLLVGIFIGIIFQALISSTTTPELVHINPQVQAGAPLPRTTIDESCYTDTDEKKKHGDVALHEDGDIGNPKGNNRNGSSNDNSNETKTETETDNHHSPTDAATRAALVSCCQIHEALKSVGAAFPFLPSPSPTGKQGQKQSSSSSSSSSLSWSPSGSGLGSASGPGASFLGYIDPWSLSTSLHDIFDLSPLASCQHENQVRGLSKVRDPNLNEHDHDGGAGAHYKSRYRRPDLYEETHVYITPPHDWAIYILRTEECMRDMIRWVGNAYSNNSDSSTQPNTPPLPTTAAGQGAEKQPKQKEREREGEKVEEGEEGPASEVGDDASNRELLGVLLEAAALLIDDSTRSVYGMWIQPHVENAKRWEMEQIEYCVQTKIDEIHGRRERERERQQQQQQRRRRRRQQTQTQQGQKDTEKGGRVKEVSSASSSSPHSLNSGSGSNRDAVGGSSGSPGWLSSGFAWVVNCFGFGGGGRDDKESAQRALEEEEEKEEEKRIERHARNICSAEMYGSEERVGALWERFRNLPGNVDREGICHGGPGGY